MNEDNKKMFRKFLFQRDNCAIEVFLDTIL